jgi:hypothetical protein
MAPHGPDTSLAGYAWLFAAAEVAATVLRVPFRGDIRQEQTFPTLALTVAITPA